MILYDYFRSSSAYRVRIALNLKQLDYERREVHLLKDGGEQHSLDYLALNPQGRVPTLVDGELTIFQSSVILDYLEEQYPGKPLLPQAKEDKLYVKMLCNIVACDMQPLNNLAVLQYLQGDLGCSDEQKQAWYEHWIHVGFKPFEKLLQMHAGQYCLGDQVTLADVYLVPQVFNAKRFAVNLAAYPLIEKIYANCNRLKPFLNAAP